jgi:ribosomal protein S18 acetylase RimI-like enzyme
VTTRPFEAPDLRALYAIEEACFEPDVRFSRSMMRSLTVDVNSRTWVSVVDEVRAGFAIVGLREQAESALENTAYIWTVEVLPVFRRMGVARELLRSVELSAREADCVAIELHVSERNVGAQSMYEEAGYAKVAVEAQYYGDEEDAFRYRKMLT